MKKKLLLLLALTLQGCEGVPTDPVIDNAKDALTAAYIQHIKSQDYTYVKCDYRLIDARNIVRCGISAGGSTMIKKAYWEIVKAEDGYITTYAMNGKALSALDLIVNTGEYKSGAGVRQPLDIASVEKVFDN